jgi:hypothetical protein
MRRHPTSKSDEGRNDKERSDKKGSDVEAVAVVVLVRIVVAVAAVVAVVAVAAVAEERAQCWTCAWKRRVESCFDRSPPRPHKGTCPGSFGSGACGRLGGRRQ